jgi:hypothetical protein
MWQLRQAMRLQGLDPDCLQEMLQQERPGETRAERDGATVLPNGMPQQSLAARNKEK